MATTTNPLPSETDDPMERLEDAAKRQKAGEDSARAVSNARAKLVLGKDAKAAFFATLALGLKPVSAWEDGVPVEAVKCGTAATDGKHLYYHPDFILSLKQEELIGLLVHETLHVANKHHARQGDRDAGLWNLACDLAINPLVLESGYKLPKDGALPGEGQFANIPKGLAAEEVYPLLLKQAMKKPRGGGKGGGQGSGTDGPLDPGRCGGVLKPGDGGQAACRKAEADADTKTAQAAQVAKQKGKLPAGLGRLVDEIGQAKVDWREVLRQFVSQQARNDYRWFPPNKRLIHLGLYLPGLRSEEVGQVVVAVDTSGSIGKDTLETFASEMQGILDAYDCELTIIYCDAAVHRIDTWKSSDGPLDLSGGMPGGGGTSHLPVWECVREHGWDPACCVCLTDLYTDCGTDPGYPVLWAVVGNENPQAPFGTVVKVE